MGEWFIYGSNGSQKATVKKLEYSGEFMGETSITCDVYSPSPISFAVGDYLVYRGEMFTIDYDATRLKQARNNTYGKGYVYENMRFLSFVGELKRVDFLDFVPSDNQVHYSQLPVFSYFAEDVTDLADRIQANLDRIYTGASAWTVQVASGFVGKTNIDVQVSNIKVYDALRLAYDQFEATFVIRGRTIIIGTAGSTLESTFKYGKGNGLKTIERSVADSDTLVTRLRAYGNTTNMPSNYYRNLGTTVYAPIHDVYGIYTNGADIHFVPKFANNYFTEKVESTLAGEYFVEVSLDKNLWLKAHVGTNATHQSTNYSVVTVGLYGNNTTDMVQAFLTQLNTATQNTPLYFRKGINIDTWPSSWKEVAEGMPDFLFIDHLMLPNFLQPVSPGSSDVVTDPYIDASNIAAFGIREKSVYFDGTDADTPDIHPTLEGMTAAQLEAAGYDIDLDSGDNGNLDEIAADATEEDGSAITVDGQFVNAGEVPGFKVTLKDIGFDINSYLGSDTATLSMRTGMCGGRSFTIVECNKIGNKYVLRCQRTQDSGVDRYYPYKDYPIKAGDKFVLTGIEMPKVYIDAASQRLLTAAQAYIAKYSAPQYVYSIKMDDIWMKRQADGCEELEDSYYYNIKEGDIMPVQDADLGIDIEEVIDRLTIREGHVPLPQFEVVLRKDKPQGTIGILQNRIAQLELRNAEQVNVINRQQSYIELVLGGRLNDIQEQVDHVQITYFGNVMPTEQNYPANEWTTDALKEQHVFDMYYDKVNDKGYEWKKVNNVFQWVEITDPNTIEALRIASKEQDTIDGKRRVFITAAGVLPTPPYDQGDLWVNATYPANNTTTDESQHKYYNDILKCVTPKADGGTASINDWSLSSKYTDDTVAEEALYKAENVKTLEGNLVLNSGFTGEYESEAVTADLQVDANTPMFSDPLRHWDSSDVTAVDNASMITGKAAEISGGWLKQTIGFLQAGTYMLSFRAQVTSLTINFFGLSANLEASNDVQRYDFQFELTDSSYGSLEFVGTAIISEIMLTQGTLKREWQPSVLDNDMAHADIAALDYLANAIAKASTTINGGLVLTQMIKVGNYRCDASGEYTMSEETGGMSGRVNNDKSPFLWGGGTLAQALYTIAKYAKNPAYQATSEEVQQMAKFVVTHGGRAILNDIVLRGYIYALGGKFHGRIEAEEGYFKGELQGATGTFLQEISSNDEKVWLTTEDNSYYGYTWMGLAISKNGHANGDLATIGARIGHEIDGVSYDYGRIALVKRNSLSLNVDSDCTIYLDSSDGSITGKLLRSKGGLKVDSSIEGWSSGNDAADDLYIQLYSPNNVHISQAGGGQTIIYGGDKDTTSGLYVPNACIETRYKVKGSSFESSSDERLKDVKGNIKLSLKDIAEAPSVLFKWKNRKDDAVYGGTIAQYWQKVAPWAVSEDGDGMLSVRYGALALAGVTAIARELMKFVRKLESVVKEHRAMKREIKSLRDEVNELRGLLNK